MIHIAHKAQCITCARVLPEYVTLPFGGKQQSPGSGYTKRLSANLTAHLIRDRRAQRRLLVGYQIHLISFLLRQRR